MHQGFFKRLQACGYKSDQIKPLFYKAIAHAQQYSGPTNMTSNDHTSIILHLPFHPMTHHPTRFNRLDLPTRPTMITPQLFSISLSTPMTHHPTRFSRHGMTQLHLLNTICLCPTCATQNRKKNSKSNA